MKFDLLIASNNAHKVHEYAEMLSPFGIAVHSLNDLGIVDEAVEDGNSYASNSLIKARSAQKFTSMPLIADDSGLEVEAFGEFPGIYSSRFAKECGGSKKANLEIIKRLQGRDKSAHFTCVITLLNVTKEPVQFTGICPGHILNEPAGEGGFGYDPIFYSSEAKQPFGTASEEIKNEYSHRAKAVKLLVNYLKDKNLLV